jgi:hypothetical protein
LERIVQAGAKPVSWAQLICELQRDWARQAFEALATYLKQGSAYGTMMAVRPQAIGYGLTDSPAGLAGWMLVHPGFATWTYGAAPDESMTKDEVLDDVTLYWLTHSATSAARLSWENRVAGAASAAGQTIPEVSVPVAISIFPEDVYRAPESWARRAYPNLIYFHEVDRGGHFAAWERPQLLSEALRAAFRSLRYVGAADGTRRGTAPRSARRPTGISDQSTTALTPVTDDRRSRRCHAGDAARGTCPSSTKPGRRRCDAATESSLHHPSRLPGRDGRHERGSGRLRAVCPRGQCCPVVSRGAWGAARLHRSCL